MEMLSESELPMKTIFRQVGAKIAYYRTLREISQEELATKLNVEEKVLVGMEQGKYRRKFSLAILMEIAEILKIDPAFFLTFTDFEKKLWYEHLELIEEVNF